MLPGIPPSEPWFEGITGFCGVKGDHPNVVRILEILRKKEATREITVAEHKEFFVLNDELLGAHEFIHGKIIHPTGEVTYYPPLPVREQIVAAIEALFSHQR
jgi:hypothetical protein